MLPTPSESIDIANNLYTNRQLLPVYSYLLYFAFTSKTE